MARRCAAKRANWPTRRSRRRPAPATRATAPRAAKAVHEIALEAARPRPARRRRPRSRGDPLGERHREDAEFVDALRDLAEAGGLHQLVHLGLGAPAHDPGLTLTVA